LIQSNNPYLDAKSIQKFWMECMESEIDIKDAVTLLSLFYNKEDFKSFWDRLE